jgi:hypothetical protein
VVQILLQIVLISVLVFGLVQSLLVDQGFHRSFSVPNMVTFISGIDLKLTFSGGSSSSVFSGVKTE